MQNNLFQSHKERQYIEGMSINTVLKQKEEEDCGCRVDAIECLEGALKNDMTVLGVDLSGSGHSEGEYITLGWNEKEDVWDLIRHMKAKGTWRSSVTSILLLYLYSLQHSREHTVSRLRHRPT